MNTNNKSKLFSIIIIALLLINTVAVSFLLLKNDRHRLPPPNPQQQGGAFNFLVKELNLDTAQIQQYQVLRDSHRNAADSIRQETRELKDSLFQLLKQYLSSDILVQQQLNAIAQNERNLDEITFNHFKQVRAICNAQQQTKFDEVIATAMRMQAPQQHHPHHPNDGRSPRGEEPEGRPEDDNRPPPPQK